MANLGNGAIIIIDFHAKNIAIIITKCRVKIYPSKMDILGL